MTNHLGHRFYFLTIELNLTFIMEIIMLSPYVLCHCSLEHEYGKMHLFAQSSNRWRSRQDGADVPAIILSARKDKCEKDTMTNSFSQVTPSLVC